MDISGTSPNICRACLSTTGAFQSVFVSDANSGYTMHLSEMIMTCAQVHITIGDGLPDQICQTCAEQAVNMYSFKLKCEVSDKMLRESEEMCNIREEKYAEHLEMSDYTGTTELKFPIKSEINIDEPLGDDPLLSDDGNAQTAFGFDPTRNDEESVSEKPPELGCNEPPCKCKDEFKCELCQKTFSTQGVLNRHRKTHEAIKKFKCGTCNKRFSRNDLLLRHKSVHMRKQDDLQLDYGGFNDTDDDDGGGAAIIPKTESGLYPCPKCGIIFTKKEVMQRHVNRHNKASSCNACTDKFQENSNQNEQQSIDSDDGKPHSCYICNKTFRRPRQLILHMNDHSGVKPHVCEICSKGFNQTSCLKDHMRVHNGEKPYLCSTCHRGFNQLGNLRQHMIRHTGIKAHRCCECGKGFATKSEALSHLLVHTGARPFVCPICSQSYSSYSSLRLHKRIHSGEKPHECDVCKKKFSRLGVLARHKRTHTGEKPYVCKFCAKAFAQSNDLKTHLRIHTGEMPFTCDVCQRAFRRSSTLKTHKKTHLESTDI